MLNIAATVRREREIFLVIGVELVRHWADFFFDFGNVDHDNCIPWAAIEESALRAFTDALFAADTEYGIDFDAAEWRMVRVFDPKHAVFDGAVFHAGGRTSATGAALSNYG
jgi:ketosteroid isomerase-like protein